MAEGKQELTSRKGFLKYLSGFTIVAGLLGQVWMFLRSIVPNVLYEPLKKFKIGKPSVYADGLTFLPEERLYIVKRGGKFHAISAVCPHLGCTVKEYKLPAPQKVKLPNGKEITQEWEFHCPCHGSKYRGDGTIYDGPAPTNLPPWELSLSPDGSLVVDTNKEVDKKFRLET